MSHMPSRPVPATLDLPGIYRLSVADYHKMLEVGIFHSGDPIELLDGLLVNHPRPLSPRAATTRTLVQHAFMNVSITGWYFHIIPAITMAESEPEPDFAVVRGDLDLHRDRHPGPEVVGLIGEVSESSLTFDRVEKGRIYARAGIPVYWIANVHDLHIEVYCDPGPSGYTTLTDFPAGQHVPIVLDGQHVGSIPVADLLP